MGTGNPTAQDMTAIEALVCHSQFPRRGGTGGALGWVRRQRERGKVGKGLYHGFVRQARQGRLHGLGIDWL